MSDLEDDAVRRTAARARVLLEQPLAHLDRVGDRYLLRLDDDLRRRPALSFDELVFDALALAGTLSPRKAGGWRLSRTGEEAPATLDRAGRPGVVEGERLVALADGRLVARRANLGESPVAWLARRRDADGRPYLIPSQAAAAERLAADHARCGVIGRLTMDWSAGPRAGGGFQGPDPAERNRFAKRRLAKALEAMDEAARAVVVLVCLEGESLDGAERRLGLPRRTARLRLQAGLAALALHYGLGASPLNTTSS